MNLKRHEHGDDITRHNTTLTAYTLYDKDYTLANDRHPMISTRPAQFDIHNGIVS